MDAVLHPYCGYKFTDTLSFSFSLHHMAYRNLVPRPRIEPAPAEAEAWSLNHWTSREVPPVCIQWLTIALQCRGYRFNPWSMKIPRAAEKQPVCHNFRSRAPWSPCSTARETVAARSRAPQLESSLNSRQPEKDLIWRCRRRALKNKCFY